MLPCGQIFKLKLVRNEHIVALSHKLSVNENLGKAVQSFAYENSAGVFLRLVGEAARIQCVHVLAVVHRVNIVAKEYLPAHARTLKVKLEVSRNFRGQYLHA